MFSQKVNHYIQENPDYLNFALGAPGIRSELIHDCGTTINRYNKVEDCGNLPLQTWCYKNVAVESFGMRPIVNSKEYFQNIKEYLDTIVAQNLQQLNESKLNTETYNLISDYGEEPLSSFLQTIRLDIVNDLTIIMSNACNEIDMFKNYNPISEGFVITDVNFTSYKSTTNDNHYYHSVLFSVVNTTRYNTITMKCQVYQDTSKIMKNWNTAINDVEDSKNVPNDLKVVYSDVYIYTLGFLNNNQCVLGVEESCGYSAYSGKSELNPQLINKKGLIDPFDNIWLQPNSLADNNYLNNGTYDLNGNVKIRDSGPANLDNLIKDLNTYNTNFRQF